MTAGLKIVRVVALVPEDDADEVHDGLARMVEYDASLSAYVETTDLTEQDEENFGDVIADREEEAT